MNIDLALKRPLAFIDCETTGTDIARDRIVEIAILKVLPGGDRQLYTYQVNPGIPIPQEATRIHGITDADVCDKPEFKDIAAEIKSLLDDCDLAGFNSNRFDIPLLMEEFMRAEMPFSLKGRKFIDVKQIFHRMEKRTLAAAYRFYCDKSLVDAHSATADVVATYEVLKAQINRYPQLNNDVDSLSVLSGEMEFVDAAGRMAYDQQGRIIFTFGKYKGHVVEEVLRKEPQYYNWIMRSQFPLHTKHVLTEIYRKVKKKRNS